MKSLSRSLIALVLLIALLSGASAQRRSRRHRHSAPKPAPVAVAKPTPAPPKPTPAPVAKATPSPAPQPVATPAPAVVAKNDIESKPVTAYTSPTSTLPVPTSTIKDMVMKLVGVIGVMLMGAMGWRKLRKPNLAKRKSGKVMPQEAALQIDEQLNLNPQQMLYVVRYAERTLLVGSSPQNLSLITDLTPGTHALPARTTAALPAPVSEALKDLATVSEVRTPRPSPEDRFSGIFDRLRAQESEELPVRTEYRVPRGEVRTIAELEEDQEELALAAAGRRSLFGNSAAPNGGSRWSGR